MKTIHSVINPLLSPEIDHDSLAIISAISLAREKNVASYVGLCNNGKLSSIIFYKIALDKFIVGNEIPKDELSCVSGKLLDAYELLVKKTKKENRLKVKLLKLIKRNRQLGKYVIEIDYE